MDNLDRQLQKAKLIGIELIRRNRWGAIVENTTTSEIGIINSELGGFTSITKDLGQIEMIGYPVIKTHFITFDYYSYEGTGNSYKEYKTALFVKSKAYNIMEYHGQNNSLILTDTDSKVIGFTRTVLVDIPHGKDEVNLLTIANSEGIIRTITMENSDASPSRIARAKEVDKHYLMCRNPNEKYEITDDLEIVKVIG